jgi:hypothetical protein
VNTEPACSGFRGRSKGHWCCFLSPKPSRHATIGRFGRKPRRPTVASPSLHQRPLVAWPNPQVRPLVALEGNLGDQRSHHPPFINDHWSHGQTLECDHWSLWEETWATNGRIKHPLQFLQKDVLSPNRTPLSNQFMT